MAENSNTSDRVNTQDDSIALLPADELFSDTPVNMTLEQIIDSTGELEHLNELVMLHVERSGGFYNTESYFATVQPVLDMLEVEIRVRYHPAMKKQEMKLLVQDWIDSEIRGLRSP
jgi:hypothetical protein